jgi:hypothetical protein
VGDLLTSLLTIKTSIMKHAILITLFLLLIIGASNISCNKSEDDNKLTKKDLLTMSPWKRTGLTSSPAYDWYGNGNSDINILNIMYDCEMDNLDIYKTNGIFETNEGPTKCDPSDPQTWTMSWAFADNETKLVFDGTDIYTILELTTTTLKFQTTFEENGVSYTHIETYGH